MMKKRRIHSKDVYRLTSQIPRGKVSSYSAIAHALGSSGGSRVVGQILKRNPTPIVVPCHRVIRSDGSLGGYAGVINSRRKTTLLRLEGLKVERGEIKDLEKVFFDRFRVRREV